MTDAKITINADGTGAVDLGDHISPVSGEGAPGARQQAIALVAARAAELDQPLTATASEAGRVWPLLISPDGTVTQRTLDTTPAAESPAPNLDATRPRAIIDPDSTEPSSPQPTTAPTAEWQQDPPPAVAATPITGHAVADPRWTELAQQPAEHGIRGNLNKIGMKFSPDARELEARHETFRQQLAHEEQQRLEDEQRERDEAAQETRRAARAREEAQREREQRALIQTNFGDCQTITVSNQKGGSHKTTVIALLAATFGRIRGGGVIAWDANETMGTLGDRTMEDFHSNTVVDLLEKSADDFSSVETSRIGTIDKYTRPQGDNHFTVLASDEDPERQDMVDGAGFRTVHQILERFNRMVFVDTGNNARADHFLAAIDATNQLVIPVSAGLDSALVAEKMIRALIARGHEDIVNNAVVMLHDSESRKADDTETARRFEGKVATVIPVPFDPALKDGGKIDYDALLPTTKRAYQEAAAAIALNLREQLLPAQDAATAS